MKHPNNVVHPADAAISQQQPPGGRISRPCPFSLGLDIPTVSDTGSPNSPSKVWDTSGLMSGSAFACICLFCMSVIVTLGAILIAGYADGQVNENEIAFRYDSNALKLDEVGD